MAKKTPSMGHNNPRAAAAASALTDATNIVAAYNKLKGADKIEAWIEIGRWLIHAKSELKAAKGGSWLKWREANIFKPTGMYDQEHDAFVAIAKANDGYLDNKTGEKVQPYLAEALAWHLSETGKPVGFGHASLYKTLGAYLKRDSEPKAGKPKTPTEARRKRDLGLDKGEQAGLIESWRLRAVALEAYITNELHAPIPSDIPPVPVQAQTPDIPANAGIQPGADADDEDDEAEGAEGVSESSEQDEATEGDGDLSLESDEEVELRALLNTITYGATIHDKREAFHEFARAARLKGNHGLTCAELAQLLGADEPIEPIANLVACLFDCFQRENDGQDWLKDIKALKRDVKYAGNMHQFLNTYGGDEAAQMISAYDAITSTPQPPKPRGRKPAADPLAVNEAELESLDDEQRAEIEAIITGEAAPAPDAKMSRLEQVAVMLFDLEPLRGVNADKWVTEAEDLKKRAYVKGRDYVSKEPYPNMRLFLLAHGGDMAGEMVATYYNAMAFRTEATIRKARR